MEEKLEDIQLMLYSYVMILSHDITLK